MYTCTKVAIKYWQSNLSIIPPCPGMVFAKSFRKKKPTNILVNSQKSPAIKFLSVNVSLTSRTSRKILYYWIFLLNIRASLVAQTVKNPPTMRETVRSLSWDDLLEESMATHCKHSCLENPHRQRNLAGYSP